MISTYGGFVNHLPKFSFLFIVFALAGLGLPGILGFLGEFLVLAGVFQKNYLVSMLATFGVVLGAAYMLWLTKRVIFGKTNNNEIKNLIIFKKALFNSDCVSENELLKILNPVINSESIWKSHSLYLLAEFFYSKNEKQKSKEFFNKDNLIEGEYNSYHENGKTAWQGMYEKNKKQGFWYHYNENGGLKSFESYKNGVSNKDKTEFSNGYIFKSERSHYVPYS